MTHKNLSQPNDEILYQAQILWDFNGLNESLEKCDCILVYGSNDLQTAFRAGQLYLDGWAPKLIVSGNVGRSSANSDVFNRPEAEIFAGYLQEMGVPRDDILIENQATNTGENVELSIKLMRDQGYDWQTFLLVQAPYMQRRAVAAFRKTQPHLKGVAVTSLVPLSHYVQGELTWQHLIEMLVADTQRLTLYYEKGFLIKTEIPARVAKAYDFLVKAGYDKHVL